MKINSILVKPTESSFIKLDEAILIKHTNLRSICLHQNKSKLAYLISMFSMIRMMFEQKYELVFIWFADYHAALAVFLANILKKKSVIFIGGYDSVYYPELKMGVHHTYMRSILSRFALKRCSYIIANHRALIFSENRYYTEEGHFDGIKHFIPELKTPYSIVYNALSCDREPDLSKFRKHRVVTVANCPRFEDIYNKGVDMIVKLAISLANVDFIVVGIKEEWLKQWDIQPISNITFVPWLSQQDLFDLLETSKVYLQPSISEGMPNALMEAMYFGCIPVGSNVAGIPTLIQSNGYIVGKRSINEYFKAINDALNSNIPPSKCSEFIKNQFSVDKRSNSLKKIIDYLHQS